MKEYLLTHLANLDPIVYIFILAMLPLFEARYAVIVAYVLHKKFGTLPWPYAFTLSVIGNVIAVIPVLYFLPWLDRIMHKWSFTAKIMDFFLTRARKRKDLIEKHGFWGLTIFVAIPVPMTGAWTGSLMAYVFDVAKKKSIVALIVGVLLATMLMTLASYGGVEFLTVFAPKVSL